MCDSTVSVCSTSSTATRKITLGPETIWMYPAIFQPTFDGYHFPPKFGVRLLIAKADQTTVTAIQQEIAAVMMGHYDMLYRGRPQVTIYSGPMHDGDREYPGHPAYKGMYYIDARTRFAPRVIDAYCAPVTDPETVHSGCRGHATISFRPYAVGAKRGVSCTLHALQLMSDGLIPDRPDSEPQCILNLPSYARYGGAPNDPQY